MPTPTDNDAFVGDLFLAGERVPPGLYRQIGSGRELCFDEESSLPASLDGRVACYVAVRHTWAQIGQFPEGLFTAHS